MKPTIFIGLVLVVIASGYFALQAQAPTQENLIFEEGRGGGEVQGIQDVVQQPTPTPDPFYDLTIPYLRERYYESSLGDLKPYTKAGSYQSYVTSYDSDGLTIFGLLTIPAGQKPAEGWPAIVFVHGYIAPSIYKTTQRYEDHVDFLARNGLVVFKIDLRGHDQSEGQPGGAYYSSDYVIDVLNARAALQKTDFVNPNGVGLWGHSMAGNVTFRAMVAEQNIPAVVVWAGAGYTYDDFVKYGVDDNSYRPPQQDSAITRRRTLLRELHGTYNPDDEFWKQVSPQNYLEGVMGAINLHHAADDSVVNVGYGRDLMKVLDGTAIEHELYEYQNGGHNIEGVSFNLAMERTVNFFIQKLR